MRTLGEIAVKAAEANLFTESPIEVRLFVAMRKSPLFILCQEGQDPTGEGYFLFPQYRFGPYRADFYIKAIGYPAKQKVWPPRLTSSLVIECDGQEFHYTDEQLSYDYKRDQYFLSHGIPTMRFKGNQIIRDADFCVQQIVHALDMGMKQ